MNKKNMLLCTGLLLIVAASAAVILLTGGDTRHPVAVISQNGVILHEIDLTTIQKPELIHIPNSDGGENIVRIEAGQVCMERASCPDQVCVKQGYIKNGALPITCLPNKVIVTIQGGDGDLDAATN